MKTKILIILALMATFTGYAQQTVKGKVTASDESPLIGATVKEKDSTAGVKTDGEGNFTLTLTSANRVISISYIGYQGRDITVSSPNEPLRIILEPAQTALKEVVVSTGYQSIPNERSTGSFVHLDETLLNRRVSTDILKRLEDVTPGLIFNRAGTGAAGSNSISIRGESTIHSNSQPLIVVDNFPYEGDISTINPNDVESISVLKDAAAASIWGARAGNGVIVIITKKGVLNSPAQISFNSNLTTGNKPDLYYQSVMTTTDFIEVEKQLFQRGYYKSAELSANRSPLTPVVELLIAKRDGIINSEEADSRIEALKAFDVRRDYAKYFYQSALNQQYSLNVSGGGESQRFALAAGFDNNRSELVNNHFKRTTLKASNTYLLANKRLELSADVHYTSVKSADNNQGIGSVTMATGKSIYPYAQFAGEDGTPLATVKDYRNSFVESAPSSGLYDWHYRPIEELNLSDNSVSNSEYRVNFGARYRILPFISGDLLYQYMQGAATGRDHNDIQSWYTRDLINRFTRISGPANLLRPIPEGGIVDLNDQRSNTHNLRGQLNYDRLISGKHQVNAIAGYEVTDRKTFSNQYRLYGFDQEHATSSAVAYATNFEQYHNPGILSVIPNMESSNETTDRYRSWYANSAYTLDGLYTFTLSGRIDQSNIFGVRANQRSVPLWSAGAAWNISQEEFFRFDLLPYLKLRLSYGYNGNLNRRLSAFTTASYSSGTGTSTQLSYAKVTNPPNPELRWERVRIVNAGLDFQGRNNRIYGSIDIYSKKGLDLIGDIGYAPSSGITTFRGNNATTHGQGIDLILNSKNLDAGFKWQTTFIFSHNKEMVTGYEMKGARTSYLQFLGIPMEGRPLYAIYSYPWAGLDPQTGNPQGYLDGEKSDNYSKIIGAATPESLIYHGSARPTTYGAIRNTISFAGFSLSANISYRLGYYFRRSSVDYGQGGILTGVGGHGEYALRWQNPGDENRTSVPSAPLTANAFRNELYEYSEILVEKGDHIRLQDIQLTKNLTRSKIKNLPVKHCQLYLYANNLGLIWKATKTRLDPDYSTSYFTPAKTIALGIKVDL